MKQVPSKIQSFDAAKYDTFCLFLKSWDKNFGYSLFVDFNANKPNL